MLTYEDGMAVELFDHVEIGKATYDRASDEWFAAPLGQITKIMPRKGQVRVRFQDGFTRTGNPKFSVQDFPIAEICLDRRDG